MPIRHARLADVEALGALLDDYRVFYGQASDPDAARRFLARRLGLGDSHLLMHCGDDGVPQGFVQLYPLFSTVRLAPQWRLNDLFVAPQARRRGLGRALMNAARDLALAHGVRQLTLATRIDNQAAQALYEALGWQRDRDFHHYALRLDGENAHVPSP
ncbi:GNAT family N-acetyltransferase [Halomonas pacifica]|uniref:N-acetyltransferase n=1 Tax=Bisbaumannia pacifica TaxID=77098 RepID=A0A510X6A4_9GAMM|nr:GNAT family N-acetyltransferase [Halomonas pacifica]MBH8579752.1 GNAT family N-acetyltransferase [Halomonas pacifica]MDC8803165.1 GNAT family N-acetyltransferase [Halomonas pacifica]GEK46939.1 N-acetyltransferase [Halomonas pacifica]